MSISEREWQQEQQRIDEVIAKVQDEIELLEANTGSVRSEVVDIRKHFWDDVTINFSNAEDLTETYFSMKQQSDVLSERERSHRHASERLSKYRRLIQSPYFGRIDFQEHGSEQIDTIYLGIASFIDEQKNEFLINDWRAPISSLYYDYGPGEAEFSTPSGTIKGMMQLKRQFVIREGIIRFLFDTGVTIGDELLQQALSRTADATMRSIVATIQKEQNQIIRNEQARMLIVQGAAGSGKTSAALQRVAYLLYKHRETLQADQMVLFSPNPLFNSYVSTVLPELGEENMIQTTFQEYLENRLGVEFQLEDPFEQIEYVLTSAGEAGYEQRMQGIRFKSSATYLTMLNRYSESLLQRGMCFKPLVFRGLEFVTEAAMRQYFYTLDASIRLNNRILLMRDWLLQEVNAFAKKQWRESWVEEEMQLLSEEDYHRAYQKLRKMQRGKEMAFDDFDQERMLLARVIVKEKLKPLLKRVKSLRFVDVTRIYTQLFENNGIAHSLVNASELPSHWSEVCRYTRERLSEGGLPYEDATPYLYLKELLQGFQMNTNVRHLIVDEAQDYSPFQLEFLKRLFPRSRMTALGDLNQAIFAHTSVLDDMTPLAALYGEEETQVLRLTRSYRSTKEIVEFTSRLLPGGEEIIPFQRTGEKPMLLITSDEAEHAFSIAAHVNRLQEEGYESIAILCKTAEESDQAYKRLCDRLALHLIKKETASFAKGIQVIPSYLAKGVEFDAVIIFNASEHVYSEESERKLFYTACTRAMHHLGLFSLGSPTALIQDVSTDAYLRLAPEHDRQT